MPLPHLSGVARLADDPELRFGTTGVAYCKLRLIFNSRKQDADGKWTDGDQFVVDATLFKQEAENVAESLQRGAEVVVSGRLKTRRYETREGEKRTAVELVVDAIGPSLKTATARVQKMQRSNGTGGTRQPDDDPWAVAPAAGGARDSRNDPPPF